MSKKKNKPVHIVCVLDRSGSMGGLQNQVIDGFNEFVEEQRKIKGKAKVTLVLFDSEYEVAFKEVPLKKVKKLTDETYYVRGTTAMNDAIGKSIQTFSKKEKVIFLIYTDGYENASREYTVDQVRELVKDKTAKGWDFNFMAADIDSVQVGGSLGIAANKAHNFAKSSAGMQDAYRGMTVAATSYRSDLREDSDDVDLSSASAGITLTADDDATTTTADTSS